MTGPSHLSVGEGTRQPGLLLLVARVGQEREEKNDKVLELKNAYQGTSYLLGDMIEADDAYTGSHSRDVVELVLAVSERLGLEGDALRMAEFTALLHDVGKVRIPPEIINKPGPLDGDERALMNTHTILGEEMLERAGGLLGEARSSARATSTGTGTDIPTGWQATRSHSSRASSARATPGAR